MNNLSAWKGAPWPSVGLYACGRPRSARWVGTWKQPVLHAGSNRGPSGEVSVPGRWTGPSSHRGRHGKDDYGFKVVHWNSVRPFSTIRSKLESRLLPSTSEAITVSQQVVSIGDAVRVWKYTGGSSRQVRVYAGEAGDGKTPKSKQPSATPESQKPRYEPPSPPHERSSQNHDYFRDHFPNMPRLHRPTKEELLAAASGFFSRLKVRFKWASIRSMRPFNSDEIWGFISLIAFGHVVWLFIGTTTFISLALLAANTVFAQESLAKWAGNYLTKSSGLTVVFESAVVPKWGAGVISFRNVFVSRRPGSGRGNVSKGSPGTAAAAQAAADRGSLSSQSHEAEDQNYTQFDVSIDTVNVTLSFTKWWNGKGMLKDVEVKGVRGVVDRTHVHSIAGVDPRSYKHEHQAGDFEIEDFKLEDVLVTIHQPSGFRPFSLSIYTCELPRLRKQWLFYDFLSANHCSGAYDDAQFNIHPRQMHSRVGMGKDDEPKDLAGDNPWKKHNRLRIDGLNIDHMNRGVEGPFGWITRGNVDIVSDIMFPADPDESISKVVSEIYSKVESTLSDRLSVHIGEDRDSMTYGLNRATSPRSETQASLADGETDSDRRCIVMDLRVRINDIIATPPAFPKDVSYINNALIRPIVAFLNSRPSWVPINGRLVKRVSDFDGSWTLFDSGLMDEVSEELYDSCVRDLQDSESRARRFKKVGIWSLQLVAQALFIGLVGNIS